MPAALISQMDPPPGERDDFDAWYRDEHIPSRLAVPGFESAVRGWAVEGEPSHLALVVSIEHGAVTVRLARQGERRFGQQLVS